MCGSRQAAGCGHSGSLGRFIWAPDCGVVDGQVFSKAVSDCRVMGCGEQRPGLLLSSVRTWATQRALKKMRKKVSRCGIEA